MFTVTTSPPQAPAGSGDIFRPGPAAEHQDVLSPPQGLGVLTGNGANLPVPVTFTVDGVDVPDTGLGPYASTSSTERDSITATTSPGPTPSPVGR